MVIKLNAELEAALNESARQQGTTPDVLATNILRERVLPPGPVTLSEFEWERLVRGLATDCGVSLPHSALSSEGLYE